MRNSKAHKGRILPAIAYHQYGCHHSENTLHDDRVEEPVELHKGKLSRLLATSHHSLTRTAYDYSTGEAHAPPDASIAVAVGDIPDDQAQKSAL